jgi:hypothetical protein
MLPVALDAIMPQTSGDDLTLLDANGVPQVIVSPGSVLIPNLVGAGSEGSGSSMFYDVREFGAIADSSVTDNAPLITAAADAAAAAGGGTVFIPDGGGDFYGLASLLNFSGPSNTRRVILRNCHASRVGMSGLSAYNLNASYASLIGCTAEDVGQFVEHTGYGLEIIGGFYQSAASFGFNLNSTWSGWQDAGLGAERNSERFVVSRQSGSREHLEQRVQECAAVLRRRHSRGCRRGAGRGYRDQGWR